jgi:alpha-mannosidase
MPKIETIYLIHHSHTDVGYTHDQPIVWELQTRFIDEALDLAEFYADHNSDGAFRWTVENTAVLKRWLTRATTCDIQRFQKLEQDGRIEVTGMFANLTPLLDTDQLIETFQILRSLREDYGLTIEHAMNCDVNGENWPLADVLLDLGIKGFTMAINTHFGGAVRPSPLPFLWESPSGRTLPANNGWRYDRGWHEGIGRDAKEFERVRFPRLQKYLDEIGYPLPILLLQSIHPYGDNGSAFSFASFIDAWNNAGKSPRIVLATPRIWWKALQPYMKTLPVLRGDWTDYWNFGSISSAREQTMNRMSRTRLRTADAMFAPIAAAKKQARWSHRTFDRYREAAWETLTLWDEHTWGADCAIRAPYSEDTVTQWHHKANYAYTARSLSLLLQRDAAADFARSVQRKQNDDLLVFNPLPYARTVTGKVPHFVMNPRGTSDDSTAGRQHQDRDDLSRYPFDAAYLAHTLPPTEIPAYGYKVIQRASLVKLVSTASEADVVENHRYHITFDRKHGGIISLYDKQLDWELVDTGFEYPLNGYISERVADETAEWARHHLFFQESAPDSAEIPPGWKSGWRAKRSSAAAVIKHTVQKSDIGITVVQTLEAAGVIGHLMQIVHLPHYADYVEVEGCWTMGLDSHPEAAHIAFPFDLPNATARYDIGFQSVIAGAEQLPGVCRDYFTVQGWVDFSNGERGVTIATPDNPMVQLGGFHFGDFQQDFNLERSLLLGWVTNNYWDTNFRAHQPGQVSYRYRIIPYSGAFDEARAHRFGLEAMNNVPLFQHLGEETTSGDLLPESGSLLILPDFPTTVQRIKTSQDGKGIIIRLLNASDANHTAVIQSGLLTITSASRCDLLEKPIDTIQVSDGQIQVTIEPRRIAVLHLEVR